MSHWRVATAENWVVVVNANEPWFAVMFIYVKDSSPFQEYLTFDRRYFGIIMYIIIYGQPYALVVAASFVLGLLIL